MFCNDRKVFGNMTGGTGGDESGSLDSDSDLILDGENDSEDSDIDGKYKEYYASLTNTIILLRFH